MRRRLLRHLRASLRVEPGRPAVVTGLRAAVATGIPLVLANLLGVPEAGWAGLTGLLVTLADQGGSYRARARVQGVVTLAGALVGALAAPAGGRPALDVVLLLLGLTVSSFARCYGDTAGSVGGQLAVIFVASLGAPAVGLEDAALRGAALLVGGLWAMLQSLLLWPVRPYRPARRAVAGVYRGLADAAEELGQRACEGAAPEVWEEALARHSRLRPRIEAARATLAATRRGRPDETPRGEHLLVLLELSEPTFAVLFALSQALEVASRDPHLQSAREQVQRLCDAYAAMARWVARLLVSERNVGQPREPRLSRRRRRARSRPAGEVSVQQHPLPASLVELLNRLREYAGAAHETAAGMHHGDPVSQRSWSAVAPPGRGARSLLEPLRSNLRMDSLVLRHALRVALVATAALVLTQSLGLGEAHWVCLSVLTILQPYSASTEERALQRVVGTLVGASFAALLATHLESRLAVVAIIVALTAVSVSLLPLNFGVFQILLTPDYMLLATLSIGDWSIAEGRALGVLIACVLALAGAWLLWPSPERRRFPDAAAGALQAQRDYLREVASRRSGTEPAVNAARRNFGLAMLEAEASFQRLLAEYHGPPQRLEPGMALLTYSRRLAASATALGEERLARRKDGELQQLASEASGTLDVLADALREGRPPPPLPPLPSPRAEDDPVSGALLERVPRQLTILHGAVERLSTELEVR